MPAGWAEWPRGVMAEGRDGAAPAAAGWRRCHGTGRVSCCDQWPRPGQRYAARGRRRGWSCVQLLTGLLFALGDLSAIRVAGILHPKECILTQGVLQQFLVGEEAAFFCQQLGNGQGASIGFGRCGVVVVDGAVGIEHPLVGGPGTLRLGTGFKASRRCWARSKGSGVGGLEQ